MHRLTLITLTAICLFGVGLTGCGSQTATTSSTPSPKATAVATGAPPKAGSTRPKSMTTKSSFPASQMASGKQDHAGEFCSGRLNPRYAGEALICVTGRLQKKRR
jgi:hypothetical protein